jgi:dTDP-4-dehydrorhamnose reductase
MSNKKNVLVLGATGMVGHMVQKVIATSSAIIVNGTQRSDNRSPFYFDLSSGLGGLEAICAHSPDYDYFINCIGILPSEIKDNAPATIRKVININTLFPHHLSAFAKERGVKVIHISTDGVFSGEAESYLEDDAHDCQDLYGTTKSLGEVPHEGLLNLRCSLIGPSPFRGEGLMEWFLKQPVGAVVSGYTNHIWHGISTYQFGKLCRKIIEGDLFEEIMKESSVFHFAPNEPVSKYELLCLLGEIFERRVGVEPIASDEKNYKRILETQYSNLKQIFSFNISARSMICELASYMNKKGDSHASNTK